MPFCESAFTARSRCYRFFSRRFRYSPLTLSHKVLPKSKKPDTKIYHPPRKLHLKKTEGILRRSLTAGPPLALVEVAKNMKRRHGTLRYHFPELCDSIVAIQPTENTVSWKALNRRSWCWRLPSETITTRRPPILQGKRDGILENLSLYYPSFAVRCPNGTLKGEKRSG